MTAWLGWSAPLAGPCGAIELLAWWGSTPLAEVLDGRAHATPRSPTTLEVHYRALVLRRWEIARSIARLTLPHAGGRLDPALLSLRCLGEGPAPQLHARIIAPPPTRFEALAGELFPDAAPDLTQLAPTAAELRSMYLLFGALRPR